jgi:flagellar hook-associated protein 2
VSTTAAPDFFRWSNIQNAADASLNVDGVDIVSGVNSVTGAIPGVTLDLTAPTTGTGGASINLSRDTTSVKTKVQNLVSAYNDTITMLNVVSDPKSTVDTYGGTLVGNAIVSTIRNKVRDMVIGYPHNATQGTKALRDLGVTIDKNGQLQIDNTKLDGALKNNFDDMVKMLSNDQEQLTQFSTTPAGLAGEAYRSLNTILDPIGGTISTLSQNQTNKVTEYQKQLDALQTRLQVILKRYTDQFSAMDALVGQIKSVQTGLKSTFDGMMATYTKN